MGVVTDTPTDPVASAAREFLDRFAGMYAGMDLGEADPVHAVRVYALERLEAGPRSSDPFTVCAMMIDALPGDGRATTLATTWCEMYLRTLQQL